MSERLQANNDADYFITKYPEEYTYPTSLEISIYLKALASLICLSVEDIECKPASVISNAKDIYKAAALGIISEEAISEMNEIIPHRSKTVGIASELDKVGEDYYYDPSETGWRE